MEEGAREKMTIVELEALDKRIQLLLREKWEEENTRNAIDEWKQMKRVNTIMEEHNCSYFNAVSKACQEQTFKYVTRVTVDMIKE